MLKVVALISRDGFVHHVVARVYIDVPCIKSRVTSEQINYGSVHPVYPQLRDLSKRKATEGVRDEVLAATPKNTPRAFIVSNEKRSLLLEL